VQQEQRRHRHRAHEVESALSDRHYGCTRPKDRVIEYLAVRKLKGGDPSGPILCFAGPPGTGKTSLGEVIAKAIGRQFYRISVGGVRDEAEVRGHRRTYVGSMPGLLIQALRRVGVRDPVFLIDEIDKMSGGGPSGDPTAAMLEVLDPNQNSTFVDHYLNLPFDLSQVLFICTANNLYDIPGPLRDRMEVIRIAGYTVEEKVEIAWRYTIPQLLKDHGLADTDIVLTDEVLAFVANRYSREAGLRNFGRNLATLMRKRARRKAEGDEAAWVLDTAKVEEALGPPRYAVEEAEKEPEIGAVTGLAWTSTGGDLMVIEALRMPGTGRLTVTGQLGDVMRESVDAALSFARARAATLGVTEKDFKEGDIHIHFPAGRDPQGRAERGDRGDAGDRERDVAALGAARRGDDRRGHAARQGARDRRREGEDARRVPRRAARGHHAEGEREGPARRPGAGAREHAVHLRLHDGRRAGARAAPVAGAGDRRPAARARGAAERAGGGDRRRAGGRERGAGDGGRAALGAHHRGPGDG
jgi:ATP-dependent Lon protease